MPRTEEEAAVYRKMAERVMEEVKIAAGMRDLSWQEMCRRAGYSEDYVANLLLRIKTNSSMPSLRFLADVEEALDVQFKITVAPRREAGSRGDA